jgi:hypothetical protein
VGWGAGRQFAVDMAGFAINLRFLLARPAAEFAQEVKIHFIQFNRLFLGFLTSNIRVNWLLNHYIPIVFFLCGQSHTSEYILLSIPLPPPC